MRIYPVLIGENAQRTGREWNGLIDEVCIFRCALDANAIGALCAGEDPAVRADRAMTTRPTTSLAAAEPRQQEEMSNAGPPQIRKNRNLFAISAVIALVSLIAGASLLIKQK